MASRYSPEHSPQLNCVSEITNNHRRTQSIFLLDKIYTWRNRRKNCGAPLDDTQPNIVVNIIVSTLTQRDTNVFKDFSWIAGCNVSLYYAAISHSIGSCGGDSETAPYSIIGNSPKRFPITILQVVSDTSVEWTAAHARARSSRL